MCGRYVSAGDLADLAVLLGVDPFGRTGPVEDDASDAQRQELARKRRFNLAPTDPVPAVLLGDTEAGDTGPGAATRQLALLTWGLVPPWAELRTGAQRINARVETVLEKPSFRRAIRSRRCLLPADGWYEWLREPEGHARRRRPFFVRPADGRLLTFAGLYEHWRAPDGSRVRTSAILTGAAPEPLAWLHERAPLVVPPELWADWLDPAADAEELLAALRDAPLPEMEAIEVSPAVNSVRNSFPELLDPVARDEVAPDEAGADGSGAARSSATAEQAVLW